MHLKLILTWQTSYILGVCLEKIKAYLYGPETRSPYLLQTWAKGIQTIMIFIIPYRWCNVVINQVALDKENVPP
jgi:hypothetical protein